MEWIYRIGSIIAGIVILWLVTTYTVERYWPIKVYEHTVTVTGPQKITGQHGGGQAAYAAPPALQQQGVSPGCWPFKSLGGGRFAAVGQSITFTMKDAPEAATDLICTNDGQSAFWKRNGRGH